MLNLLRKIKILYIYGFHNYIEMKNVQMKNNYLIRGKIYIKNKGTISIKKNLKINSGSKYNQVGYNKDTRITVLKNARLEIGSNVGISNTNIFCQNEILIGDNVIIGGGTNIWDTNFHSLNYEDRCFNGDQNIKSKKIIIEKNVFIGANVTILKGIIIGFGSVIGSGSIVSKSIPKNEIWAGNPIKFIKKCNLECN